MIGNQVGCTLEQFRWYMANKMLFWGSNDKNAVKNLKLWTELYIAKIINRTICSDTHRKPPLNKIKINYWPKLCTIGRTWYFSIQLPNKHHWHNRIGLSTICAKITSIPKTIKKYLHLQRHHKHVRLHHFLWSRAVVQSFVARLCQKSRNIK